MQSPQTTRVRQATTQELDAVVDVLADAFEADPVMRWVTPKTSYPRYAFDLTIPFCLGHGHTYITEDDAGVASWLPPGVALQSPLSLGVIWKGLMEYGPGSLVRALATLLQMQKRHPTEAHYYLFSIGTRGAQRGRGVGSTLMREVLAKCDEERMPAYLESSNVKNLPFYRSHGFEVIDEFQLVMNGPTMWLMWRPARLALVPPKASTHGNR